MINFSSGASTTDNVSFILTITNLITSLITSLCCSLEVKIYETILYSPVLISDLTLNLAS